MESLERRTLLSNAIAVGSEFRVNTYATGYQSFPSVASDRNGNFVVVWWGSGEGDDSGIFAQRYDVQGVPQGNEFRVNTGTPYRELSPSVAMDADGEFVVTWDRDDGSFYSSDFQVYAQRYDAAGVRQGTEFRVNTYTTAGQGNSCIAMDADGDFVIAWQSSFQDGSGEGIFAQRYNAAGVPQGAEFRVNAYTSSNQYVPSIAMDAEGDFVVAWAGAGYGTDPDGIYARRYNATGMAQGMEFRVNTYTTFIQQAPSVATDADGDFVVAWSGAGQGDYGGVFAQRYNAAGARLGTEFRVNATTEDEQSRASVAMDADGDFVIAWSRVIPYSSYQNDFEAYAQRYNAAGVREGAEFRVDPATRDGFLPSVAMDADGDFVIAWSDGTPYGYAPFTDVYAQRYAVVPEVTSSSFLFESSPHRLRFRFNHDVRSSLATDDLVVQNLTTGQIIPSSQFTPLYDPASDVATFIYLGPGEAPIAGVLPDGRYRATLLAPGISTPQGASLASDHTFDFSFLNGDANRDGRVNVQDFTILAANFGHTGTDFAHGDFTYDGTTNLEDFTILAGRFGQALASTEIGMTLAGVSPAVNETLRDRLDELD